MAEQSVDDAYSSIAGFILVGAEAAGHAEATDGSGVTSAIVYVLLDAVLVALAQAGMRLTKGPSPANVDRVEALNRQHVPNQSMSSTMCGRRCFSPRSKVAMGRLRASAVSAR